VSFWSRGRSKEAEDAPIPARPIHTPLAVVELWGSGERTLVGMDLSQGRLIDLVNRDDAISVVVLDERLEDLSELIEMRADQAWTSMEVEDALLILPPPQAPNPQRRLHRPRQPVEIIVGRFVISGMVHVPPGAQAASFLFRQNVRYAAVTRAVVRDTEVEGFEQHADVVLVNMHRIDSIRDVGLDQVETAAAPQPSAPSA
jgi:hypothetical protein